MELGLRFWLVLEAFNDKLELVWSWARLRTVMLLNLRVVRLTLLARE